MENPIAESPKIEDEEETAKQENETETEIVAASMSPPPIIDYEAKKIARDAKAKRKDEKTVQQVLKSLDGLKSPEEKLSAMCKKYSELLHENRQLQATFKQSEKKITLIHREKEQFRNERSKAVVAKTRMEQLCRELQKLNKAQQEETALKLRVEEEKRKEICFTFQSAFAEMNTLTNQNNEKSAKMREENLEMREKIKAVQERIELTETQLDKVRQQAKLELELAREKLIRVTLELTSEKEALMEDKSQLLMKLAKYHVRVKEHEGTEQFLRKQINVYEEKFEEFKRDVKKTTESLKNFRPESREMKKKMLKLEKETALWKQRWEKTNAGVLQMTEIKEKRDAEMITLNNKLSTLQELCKAFQRERASLIAQLREKNNEAGVSVDRKPMTDENRKSMKQVENISKDCEKLKDNLTKLEGSLSEAVRETFRATVYEEDVNDPSKVNKKQNKKAKNELRKKTGNKKQDSGASDESEATSVEKNEENTKNLDKLDNIETNKIEATEVEIAILERHENVLKDIEKVLAEQAILEAKIACVKELGKSINDTDDVINEITNVDSQITEVLKIPLEKNENLKILEIVEKVESSIVKDQSIKKNENFETGPKIDGIMSTSQFEIVLHGEEPDTAICEDKTLDFDDKTKSTDLQKLEESQKIVEEPEVPKIVDLPSEEKENLRKIVDLPSEKKENSTKIVDLPSEKKENSTKIVDSPSEEMKNSKIVDSSSEEKENLTKIVDSPSDKNENLTKIVDLSEEKENLTKIVDLSEENKNLTKIVDSPSEEKESSKIVDSPSEEKENLTKIVDSSSEDKKNLTKIETILDSSSNGVSEIKDKAIEA